MSAFFGGGPGPIAFSRVSCQGHEQRLLDCSRSQSISSCGHNRDVGVRCYVRTGKGPATWEVSDVSKQCISIYIAPLDPDLDLNPDPDPHCGEKTVNRLG